MDKKLISLVLVTLAAIVLGSACSAPAEQPQASASMELSELEAWDLLWISDSSGWGVAEVYAAYIEADTGIPVNVFDNWSGGLSAGTVLDILEGGDNPNMKLARIPELIAEAEVIVFYTNPEESINEQMPGEWNCGQESSVTYVNACEPDTFSVYVQDLESIYEHIFELRAGQPTIVRAFDAYNPTLARWKADGSFDACRLCWGNYNAAIHQAAGQFNIPVARVYDAWNGSDHNQDPNDKGWTKDGIHPNEAGARIIAQELRKLGYDPVKP